MNIREVTREDAGEIAAIYNYYVLNTTVTFEEEPLAVAEIKKRIDKVTKVYPWLVMDDDDGKLTGYSYAGPWHHRSAFRYTAESSIYIANDACGRGLGRLLYSALLERLKEQRIHSVIGSLSLPNPGSVALHEKLGFEKIGHLKEVGWKFGQWLDVGYWEMILKS